MTQEDRAGRLEKVIGNWEPFTHRVTVICRMWTERNAGEPRKGFAGSKLKCLASGDGI